MNLQPMRIKQIYITTLESINSLTKFPFLLTIDSNTNWLLKVG